jgi:hypothetical protein
MGRVSDKLRNRFDMLAGRIKQQLSKEDILLAYVNHQHDAIFLTGIPDVKGSLPHA